MYGPLMSSVHVAPYPYASQLPRISKDQISSCCLEHPHMHTHRLTVNRAKTHTQARTNKHTHTPYHNPGAMSMTTSKTVYRTKYGPLMSGVHVAPYPYASQLPRIPKDQISSYCLEQLEMVFKQQTTPDETAAIIMEPVLGTFCRILFSLLMLTLLTSLFSPPLFAFLSIPFCSFFLPMGFFSELPSNPPHLVLCPLLFAFLSIPFWKANEITVVTHTTVECRPDISLLY